MSDPGDSSSGAGNSGDGAPQSGLTVPEAKLGAAQALLIVQSLIAREDGPGAYKADPSGAFAAEVERRLEDFSGKEIEYGDIPPGSRRALESLSEEELTLLSGLDETFVKDGLYVEVPDPGKLFFK
jgi:hypothetical protein